MITLGEINYYGSRGVPRNQVISFTNSHARDLTISSHEPWSFTIVLQKQEILMHCVAQQECI
jgi:hypothetical protein